MQSWLDCLKADKNAIFVASGTAERVCEFMRTHAMATKPQAVETCLVVGQLVPEVAGPKRRGNADVIVGDRNVRISSNFSSLGIHEPL